MLITRLIKVGVEVLSDLYPDREAREIVFACLEHFAGTKKHTHIIEPGYEVAEEQTAAVLSAFERLAEGEPLQYVIGEAYFYGRTFRVTPDTLIPRPETELLCREVLNLASSLDSHIPHLKVLDLCTGSGCIAWTLALEMPGAEVTAVDLSEGALGVASTQDFAEEMSQTGAMSPTFIRKDVLTPVVSNAHFSQLAHKFDIIVSNPPYVMDSEKALMRKNVLEHEPHMALFVPDADPLVFYRAVADWASELLAPSGFGFVEINEALGEETALVFRNKGFENSVVVKDLYDKERFVRFSWK